ncbi:MAG: hypothetical protein H8E74_11870 [Gammaproteobacteria bacterium]|nr:hypothetical protein [Gammaproteobacteria bacterium]
MTISKTDKKWINRKIRRDESVNDGFNKKSIKKSKKEYSRKGKNKFNINRLKNGTDY